VIKQLSFFTPLKKETCATVFVSQAFYLCKKATAQFAILHLFKSRTNESRYFFRSPYFQKNSVRILVLFDENSTLNISKNNKLSSADAKKEQLVTTKYCSGDGNTSSPWRRTKI